ncbi:MAG: hypothetical protein AAFU73_07770 [Planctomycetota bacterium]
MSGQPTFEPPEERAAVGDVAREALQAGDLFAYLRGVVLRRPLRFGLTAALVAGAFFGWSQSSAPVYRSNVKVRVEDVAAETPQLGHRGIPAGATTADEALTALRSRTLAAELVRPRSEDAPFGLGLTTWVTDENASPLSRALRRASGRGTGSFRVEAQALRLRDDAPRAVRLRFVDDATVRLSVAKGRPGVEWPDERLEELVHVPGETLLYEGFAIDLQVIRGAPDDRVWRIEALEEDVAIDRVLARVRVDEQQHQTGTLGITVTDEDPVRAARIANGLANAFVGTDLARTQERARGRAEYVEGELDGRREELDALYGRRAALLVRHPDAVAPDAVGIELAQREGAWDDAWRRAHGDRVAGERAETRLDEGDSPRVALASLPGGIPPELVPLLESLEAELGQLRQVGRGTLDNGYRRTLLLKSDDATVAAQAIDARVMDLAAAVHALERGDDAALARLADTGARDGSVLVDGSVRARVDGLAKALVAREELLLEFKPTAPPVLDLDRAIEDQRIALVAGLRAQLDGIEAARRRKAEYADFWRELYDRYPDDEARVIEESTAVLSLEVRRAFASWVQGRRAAEDTALEERDRLRTRVQGIALAQRELERMAPELAQLESVVADLLKDADDARIAAAGIEPSARVVDAATVPRRRLKPRASFGLAAGLFLGLLVALAWATASSEALRGRAGPSGARTAGVELGAIGALPPTAGAPRALLRLRNEDPSGAPLWTPVLGAPGSDAAHAYRRLRARVSALRSTGDARARSIGIVASARDDERHVASTVALNLALARALGGERVALVDAQFASPMIEAALQEAGVGLIEAVDPDPLRLRRGRAVQRDARRPGLAQALAARGMAGPEGDRATASPTSVPGLDVLGPGDSLAAPSDLLASAAFADFVAALEERYDAVVVSLPSPAASADAEAAAHALDGFALVHVPERGALTPTDVAGILARAGGVVLGTATAVEIERRTRGRDALTAA